MKLKMKPTVAFYTHNDTRITNDFFLIHQPKDNPYVLLAESLILEGYGVHTLDIFKKSLKEPDICVFLDIPPNNIHTIINKDCTKAIVLLREADMVCKRNYDIKRHLEFDVILTWKRNLIDQKKYFLLPSTKFDINRKIEVADFLFRKLCVLINSNLQSNVKGELYSERRRVIEWFEKNQMDSFDLFGYGWDTNSLTLFNKKIFKTKLLSKKLKTYKGIAFDKLLVLSKYKFSICFENTNNINYYITEKIFDSFLAGTVPVYWGTPNISDLIPPKCFVDYRNFNSLSDLYNFMKNISDKDYLEYIKNINEYLTSYEANEYSLNNWIESVKSIVEKK